MFESSVELTPEQVEWLDKCIRIANPQYLKPAGSWQLNPTTGLVDVNMNFYCINQGLSDFKGVRFGEVGGNFECRDNQLTSLEGAPQKVGGSFDCKGNGLTSLEGAPREVGGYFFCGLNELTTLEGAPQKVGNTFWCDNNQLTSLEGAPREVGGGFRCYHNPVSKDTLGSIFGIMETGKSYLEAVEYLWSEISLEDQILLYRPEFEWVVGDERKKLDALIAYQGFKGMI